MTTKREVEALIPRVKDKAAAEALEFLVTAVGRLEREVDKLRQATATQVVAKKGRSQGTDVRKARKSNLD